MQSHAACTLAVTLAALACSGEGVRCCGAPSPTYTANLSGDQVVGGSGGTGNGSIILTLGADSGLSVLYAHFSGLSGTPTKIAVYTGGVGTNGTEEADLCGGVGPACTAGQDTSLASGLAAVMVPPFTKGQLYSTSLHPYGSAYVLVTTAAKPAPTGEIRGALVFSPLASTNRIEAVKVAAHNSDSIQRPPQSQRRASTIEPRRSV